MSYPCCMNCKYVLVNTATQPCSGCFSLSNWEQQVNCETCKHSMVDVKEEPCRSCNDSTYSKWEVEL